MKVYITVGSTLRGKTLDAVEEDGGFTVEYDRKKYWFAAEDVMPLPQSGVPPLSPVATGRHALPTDSAERKKFPLFSGLLAYFPAALAQVSNHSYLGNEKHNPGLPMQHARGRSSDHEDCVVRHLVDAKEWPAGSTQRIDELRGVAWRALALLQEECELSFAPPAPAATFDRGTK